MSQLHDNVIQQEAQIIGQCLTQIRAQIETLALVHFQTSAHPVNGLADKFREFHEIVVSAEKKHGEYLVGITPKPVMGPPPSVVGSTKAEPDNISEFPAPPEQMPEPDAGVEEDR
jgi:hypothetical protein